MGIVSLVMMTSVQTTQTAKKKVNQDQVIETATLKLRQVLNKIRLPDTPVDVLTCNDVIINAGAIQPPPINVFFQDADLGEGVTIDNIAAAFSDGGAAERRTVDVVITFNVLRDRQVREVRRTVQTMVSLDENNNVTSCLSYDAQRIRDPAYNDSCRLIFNDCAEPLPVVNTFNDDLDLALRNQVCEALGSVYDPVALKCVAVMVERQLESTNIKLNGSDDDEICIDGANCRQVFDNTPCPAGTQLRGMGIPGEGPGDAGKTCDTVAFPMNILPPPGTCPETSAATVNNCTLPQTMVGGSDVVVSGMCSGSGTCSATCQTDGSWTGESGACGGTVDPSWCTYTPGQVNGACSPGIMVQDQSTPSSNRGLLHWRCVDNSLSAPNDRVACRTCVTDKNGVPDGSGGFVDVVSGSCQCQSGMTGSCTVSCNTSCGCAHNDVACNNACDTANGWIVGSNTCTAGLPDPLYLSLGSGTSAVTSPEMTLVWDGATSQFVEKDGSSIASTSNININSYISLYGGVPPYTGTWNVVDSTGDSTWQITNTTADPSTSLVNFTANNTTGFLTQLVPDQIRVELEVTDSNSDTVSSYMWIQVNREIDCSDYSVSPSALWGVGLTTAVTSCRNDYTAAKNDCTSNGCFVYGEVVDAGMAGRSSYDDCYNTANEDKEFQVDCRDTAGSCAANTSATWSVASNNCSLVGSSQSLAASADGAIVTVSDDNSGDGNTGTASFQCVGTTWQEIDNATYPSSCGSTSCANSTANSLSSINNETFPNTGSTLDGASLTGSCPVGFSGTPRVTCSGGNFIDIIADPCVATSCPNSGAPTLTNGSFSSTGTTANGADLTASCDSGYSGSPTITCTAGSFGAVSGSCSASSCPNSGAPSVTNGSFSSVGSTADGANLAGTCDSGYSGSPTVSCSGGSFGAVSGTCTAVSSCGTYNNYAVSESNWSACNTESQNVVDSCNALAGCDGAVLGSDPCGITSPSTSVIGCFSDATFYSGNGCAACPAGFTSYAAGETLPNGTTGAFGTDWCNVPAGKTLVNSEAEIMCYFGFFGDQSWRMLVR